MSDLIRVLETEYKYTADEAAKIVKEKKGFIHVSMESKVQKDGSKLWRVVGYKKEGAVVKSVKKFMKKRAKR